METFLFRPSVSVRVLPPTAALMFPSNRGDWNSPKTVKLLEPGLRTCFLFLAAFISLVHVCSSCGFLESPDKTLLNLFFLFESRKCLNDLNVMFSDRSSESKSDDFHPEQSFCTDIQHNREGADREKHRELFLNPQEQETDQNALQPQDRLWFK